MAELEISNRLLPALRYFIWVALPFIFFWVAVEKVFEGQSYRALASLGAAVLSFVAAVYWYRIIPARFRDEAKELQYLRTDQSFIWVPLPFTFSFIAVGRFFDGGSGKYQALGFLAMAVLTFVVGVYWDRIIPARSRTKQTTRFLKRARKPAAELAARGNGQCHCQRRHDSVARPP